LKEAELAEIGDKNQAVLLEVAEGLRLMGESVEVVVGGLDFDYSALGVLENGRFGISARPFGLREEPSVGHACALIA
jgi:hypothetical protein